MINNGFVNKESIEFRVSTIKQPFIKNDDSFILFQFDDKNPRIKYVWINGSIILPPIEKNIDIDITEINGNFSIVGKEFNLENIPSTYKVIGYFNTPNSYKLNSEVWLISNIFNIEEKNGTHFILNTPQKNKLDLLNRVVNNNRIEIIHSENFGSYSLQSNKLLTIVLKLTIFLIYAVFIMVSYVWFTKDKYLIRVLYLHGYSVVSIYVILIKYKVLPYILISSMGTILFAFIQIYSPLWSWGWVFHSLLILFGTFSFLFVNLLVIIIFYTSRKGGIKF